MERIIVTVKRQNETRVRDLEVPVDLESEQLAEIIATALHWDRDATGAGMKYRINADPPGRILKPSETLTVAMVENGAWLVFVPEGTAFQPLSTPSTSRTSSGPVIGWRDLLKEMPGAGSAAADAQTDPAQPPKSQPGSGYVWKEFDPD